MELVGPSKRKIASAFTGIFFAIGQVFLGMLAYYVRNYQWLHTWITIPAIAFLSYWWCVFDILIAQNIKIKKIWKIAKNAFVIKIYKFYRIVPESARWLISQQRYNDADRVMRTAARINKKTIPEKWWENIDDFSKNDELKQTDGTVLSNRPACKHNYLDLIRTPKLRRISLTTFFCWPVVSMVYYGMSMKVFNFLK